MSQSMFYLFKPNTMKLPSHSLLVLAMSLAISTSALAQYVWLDENDHKQFSDHPPPTSVPKNKILKLGGKVMSDQSSTSPASTPDKQPESVADKDLAYKKRHDELAAKEKKEATEAKVATTNSENCRRLKEYKQSLDSGQRIRQMDAAGTPSFMTDEKRTQELNEVRQNMSECN